MPSTTSLQLAAASDTTLQGLGVAGTAAGFGETATPLASIIAGLINVVLGMTGIVFLILMVYAGFLYVLAGGEAEKTKKAKSLIANAVIGIVLIIAAYAITSFVVSAIAQGVSG